MSAPRMTPSDWRKVTRPAETKPISISVVADEDWMSAVTSAPEPTAARRVRVIAREQVAEVPARRALQPLADELHAVEQQRQAAEEGEQGHGERPSLEATEGAPAPTIRARWLVLVHRQHARAARPR